MSAIQRRIRASQLSQNFTDPIFTAAGAPDIGAYASLVVNPAGDKNALNFIAQTKGIGGNDITIQYQKQAVADVPIAVTVTVKAILVKLQKDGGGNVVDTALDVAEAIAASADARALVRTDFVADNGNSADDTVIVAELGPTNLAGGIDAAVEFAWAKVGTIPAGELPLATELKVTEAFVEASGGDTTLVHFRAYQAAKGGQPATWDDGFFSDPAPTTGDPLSAIRNIAGRVLKWLPTGPAVATYFLHSVAMKSTAYTLDQTDPPASVLARRVSLTHATVATTDTLSTAVVIGLDEDGAALSETIALVADATVLTKDRFAHVTSITTAGWVQGGATADNILAGYAADGIDPELDADIYLIVESAGDHDVAPIIAGAGSVAARVMTAA